MRSNLENFLVKAKLNSYASGKEAKILHGGTKQFVYEENGFKYVDEYSGFNPFIGKEFAWKDGELVWLMNYEGRCGNLYAPNAQEAVPPAGEIYKFLKEALRNISKKEPFRGQDKFRKDRFVYYNQTYGDINSFGGFEKIYWVWNKLGLITPRNTKFDLVTPIYELVYSGALLKRNLF